mmetsp:Transcript_23583/g.39885  ORF Transcript_23583/g.39885 Transcript_23583/m.39885 type:complete len:206 (+) Transcript_23583:3878-4495(+)
MGCCGGKAPLRSGSPASGAGEALSSTSSFVSIGRSSVSCDSSSSSALGRRSTWRTAPRRFRSDVVVPLWTLEVSSGPRMALPERVREAEDRVIRSEGCTVGLDRATSRLLFSSCSSSGSPVSSFESPLPSVLTIRLRDVATGETGTSKSPPRGVAGSASLSSRESSCGRATGCASFRQLSALTSVRPDTEHSFFSSHSFTGASCC